ncbi:PREDICTED: epithelial chloride channel protein-like [Nanorana parkeri]|uniref:epithelial chloride channel protein-like n=1 Tax=Nanorana parkeri TaxID=125878 RepID=UPI000854C207|nr:PREDICTED: epithelial chloride channel protein-like [Nanorana parkeri]
MQAAANIQLRDHGYENIIIAIHAHVPEDPRIITNLKKMVTEASHYLFNATKRRFFYREVKILIPSSWKAYSLQKPRHEAHQMASIIVSNPNAYYGNDPYTLHYGGCGNEGRYIHFTPDFLSDDNLLLIYGLREKVFVHEWAHFRWGVFDEYSYEEPFYISVDGKIKATRCSSDLAGMYICKKTSCSNGNCIIDPQTGNLEAGCMFLANRTQTAKSSIMYMQALSSVAEFCYDHDHEKEAPNMQNKMCSYRSTWEVISSSYDYKSTLPKSGTELPSPPSFSLMQIRERVVCLVLDVSENMAKSKRLHQLRQAAAIFIQQIVEEGSYLGIVAFNETADVKNQLLHISSDDIRRNFISNLPVTSGGGVSICSGISSALQVIKGLDGGTEGSEIILAVSGNDRNINKCLYEVSLGGSVIHTIAIGLGADPELEQFAEITGGLTFYASDANDSENLIRAFMGISPKHGNIGEPFVVIKSIQKPVKAGGLLFGSMVVDSGVGNDTTFIITWQASEPPDVVIKNSNGYRYTYLEHDNASHVSYLKIPGIAQSGIWQYRIKNSLNDSQTLGVLVTSRPSSEIKPTVHVTAGKISNTITSPHSVTLFVEVKHGFTAVLGANVTAVIEPENGDPLTLTLLDDGAGADVTKGDGIYSIFLFRFSNNGRHSLKMYAEWTNTTSLKPPQSNPAMYVPGYIENGTINMNPPRPVYKDQSTNEMFSRVLFLGSFIVVNVSLYSLDEDHFPPCKITDLEAKMENEHVVLFWTAPGDDYDQGAASDYDIRTSTNPFILRQHFSRATVINVSYTKPKDAGTREMFIFRLGNKTADQGIIAYIAIRSTDKTGQRSEVSNLVHVTRPRFQEEDTNHAYSANVVNSSTTAVIVSAAFAIFLCLALVAAVYKRRKCSFYGLTNQKADNGSLTNYRVTQQQQRYTKCQNEEFCQQGMSSGDGDLLGEHTAVLEEIKID